MTMLRQCTAMPMSRRLRVSQVTVVDASQFLSTLSSHDSVAEAGLVPSCGEDARTLAHLLIDQVGVTGFDVTVRVRVEVRVRSGSHLMLGLEFGLELGLELGLGSRLRIGQG